MVRIKRAAPSHKRFFTSYEMKEIVNHPNLIRSHREGTAWSCESCLSFSLNTSGKLEDRSTSSHRTPEKAAGSKMRGRTISPARRKAGNHPLSSNCIFWDMLINLTRSGLLENERLPTLEICPLHISPVIGITTDCE